MSEAQKASGNPRGSFRNDKVLPEDQKHKNEYLTYTQDNLNRKLMGSIKVGDYVKFGSDRRGMKVWGVSDNYILAGTKAFHGKYIYTVICKEIYTRRSITTNGEFLVFGEHGPDDRLFGYFHDHAYELDNEEFVKDYLEAFETGELKLSGRRSVYFYTLKIRRPGGKGKAHE